MKSADTPPDPDALKSSERALLNRLKAEIMELRFRARRYDEIRQQFPAWRARAERYDELAGELSRMRIRAAFLVLALGARALPLIGRSARRRSARASPPRSPAGTEDDGAGAAAADCDGRSDAGKRQICILSGKAACDPTRIPRMAQTLIDAGYAVTVVAVRLPAEALINICPQARYVAVTPPPVTGKPQRSAMTYAFADAADKATSGLCFDVVQADDICALAAAARLAARDRSKLIWDAVESHEPATHHRPVEALGEWVRRRKEAAIFRKADAMIAVGSGLADWYARRYRIERPLIVRNCWYYWPYAQDPRLRADAGIGKDDRVVVWFGPARPTQELELLLDAVSAMPPHIHLAVATTPLTGWTADVGDELVARAAALGVAGRVHVLAPRPPSDLVPYISGADLGLIPCPGEHLSESCIFPAMVMARLPIAACRVGDLEDLIRERDMGDVFDEGTPGDIAATIARMIEPATYERLKRNVMAAAEDLTWEAESAVYLAAIRPLMPPATPRRAEVERAAAAGQNMAAHRVEAAR